MKVLSYLVNGIEKFISSSFNELSILYNTRKLSLKKYIKEIDPLLNGINMKIIVLSLIQNIFIQKKINLFKDFIESEEQIIAISSPYGTGKTYTFKQLIPKY